MKESLSGQRIGFIGLGLMGKPIARLLRAAGAALIIHNRSRGVIDELVAEGMQPAASPAEVARAAGNGIVMLCLTKTKAVEAVMRGDDGLLTSVAPGTLVIDMGTTAVGVTRELDRSLRERGCSLVDAPVSGGEVGALAGTLSVMAGGGEADFERALPVLRTLGKTITHMGPSGAGQVTKMANQVIVALTVDAVAEALALAEAAGVDPAKVRDAIRGGFAESRILELHGKRMVERDFTPGGRATGQLKDVREACQLMEELGLDLPTLKASLPLWERVVDEGHGDLDHSAIFKLYDPRRPGAGS